MFVSCYFLQIHLISSDCLEESKRVNAALKREETFRKIAAEEKEKHLEAVKEIEIARNLLTKEGYERELAELNYLRESVEKQKIAHALFLSDKRYKRYTREEIKMATGNFSVNNLIGEGAYGKVYTCKLDHIPVAIKVLRPGADKKHEFLKEVFDLSTNYIIFIHTQSQRHDCFFNFSSYSSVNYPHKFKMCIWHFNQLWFSANFLMWP